MLRKLKWQIQGEPLAARYNWCQGPVPGRGPDVEKHWSSCTTRILRVKRRAIINTMALRFQFLTISTNGRAYILHHLQAAFFHAASLRVSCDRIRIFITHTDHFLYEVRTEVSVHRFVCQRQNLCLSEASLCSVSTTPRTRGLWNVRVKSEEVSSAIAM